MTKFNFQLKKLRDAAREWEDVKADFNNRLDQSIDAVARDKDADAPMVSFKNINGKVSKRERAFRIGFGKGNHFFAHGIHGKNDFIELTEANIEMLKELKEDKETRVALEDALKKKFEAQQANGKKGQEQRLANVELATNSVVSLSNKAPQTDTVSVSLAS